MFDNYPVLLMVGIVSGWSHDPKRADGPASWGGSCQTGERQSPVDLPSGPATTVLPPLFLAHWDAPVAAVSLRNDGHSVNIAITPRRTTLNPTLSGGGLGHMYTLAGAHLHWGAGPGAGSEHTMAGLPYSMELHFVHYKESAGGLGSALAEGEADSLAVLGVFLQLSTTPHPGIARLIPGLAAVRETGSRAMADPLFTMAQLLPEDLNTFYRYNGSLTTPGCNEVVQWTVLKQPLQISRDQLEAFRQLLDSTGRPLVDNYRDVQRLGQRTLLNVETDDPVFCSTQTVRSSPEVQNNPQSALPNFVSR